jgi:hypothetical protein
MFQADGCVTPEGGTRFGFIKQRKIDRCREILHILNAEFTERTSGEYTIFHVLKNSELNQEALNLMGREKLWGSWLLTLNYNSLNTILNELEHWDGTAETRRMTGSIQYFTSIQSNAEWVQTIAHLVGSRAIIFSRSTSKSKGLSYTVNITLTEKVSMHYHPPKTVDYNGRVYCVEVPSGMILVRRCGLIAVCGNTNYDVSPRTFAAHVGINEKKAKGIMALFDRTFPNIRGVFHVETQNQLRKNRTLTNPFGRRRVFLGRWGGDLFREAYAFIPQSTVGDIINRCGIRLRECLPTGAKIRLQVHDELVISCKREQVEEVANLFKREVEQPVRIKGEDLVIPIELGVGKNWKHTVDVDKWLKEAKCVPTL